MQEQQGYFYLGKTIENDEAIWYEASDLTTHAMIIGMTGSGKTGLGVSLLEEAALNNIPVIAMDPKGDLGNLALNFPQCRPQDFLPFLEEQQAKQENISLDELAARTAENWQKGIERSGQSLKRMQTLALANRVMIYSPGSDRATPLALIGQFDPPPAEIAANAQDNADYLEAAVTALLTLIGADSDPLAPVHIFLSRVIADFWQEHRSVTLPELIASVQTPGFDTLGVMSLESVFPAKDRQKLALSINRLIASPQFASWLQGAPLDIAHLFYDSAGRAQTSVLNIAHLSDSERQFFVTYFLGKLINWMRAQSGTSHLRAIFYMDEVFGYLPPVANPPSKKHLLTLLKQARAQGLGLVLATQNPVDLDYKALANMGTWLIGKLQTEQDRNRVINGLISANEQGLNKDDVNQWFNKLGKRIFLLHNVHDKRPYLFNTRWCMSYLAGPLSDAQLKWLKNNDAPAANTAPSPHLDSASAPAITPPQIKIYYSRGLNPVQAGAQISYQACALARVHLHFTHSRSRARLDQEETLLCPLEAQAAIPLDWREHHIMDEESVAALENTAPFSGHYLPVPSMALESDSWKAWERSLKQYLRQNAEHNLLYAPTLKAYSLAGESENEFRQRLQPLISSAQETEIQAIEKRYTSRIDTLQRQVLNAETALAREKSQVSGKVLDVGISVGSTVLGVLLGRKKITQSSLSRVSSSLRKTQSLGKERQDVQNATEKLKLLQKQMDELLAKRDEECAAVQALHADTLSLEQVEMSLKAADIDILELALLYRPGIMQGEAFHLL